LVERPTSGESAIGIARSRIVSVVDPRLSLGSYLLHDRFRIGKPSRLKLRIDVFTIHLNFERAAAGRHERQRFNILFQLEELLRQTDGMRLVVSSRAILNTDLQAHNAHNVESRPLLVKVPAIL
jgi:hypothetical protein